MASLEFDVAEAGDAVIVRLAGELDMDGVLRLETALTDLVERPAMPSLVLDLQQVSFIDSTGLGLILQTHQAAQRSACALTIVEAPEGVQRVFRLAGLQDILPFRVGSH